VSKSIEEQEIEACSEGSSRKTKKNKGKKLGGEEAIVTPISSQPVDELGKDKSIMEEPTASKKNKTSQSQKTSPNLIPKTKRQQRKEYGKGECLIVLLRKPLNYHQIQLSSSKSPMN
jgi:hypothetical protein